jgi:hypothetical protein
MTQRLPRVSQGLVSTIAGATGQLDLEQALKRLMDENPQLVLLADSFATNFPAFGPLAIIAIAYELLNKQADVNWTEEHC